MLSLKTIFDPSNVYIELDLTDQRVHACTLLIPQASMRGKGKASTASCYGWSLTGPQSANGYGFNPSTQTLKELGFGTRSLARLELADDAPILLVHLEEIFPAGVAAVRKIECGAQAAMARFGGAIAELILQVPDLEIGVSEHCLMFASHVGQETSAR